MENVNNNISRRNSIYIFKKDMTQKHILKLMLWSFSGKQKQKRIWMMPLFRLLMMMVKFNDDNHYRSGKLLSNFPNNHKQTKMWQYFTHTINRKGENKNGNMNKLTICKWKNQQQQQKFFEWIQSINICEEKQNFNINTQPN